jgi:hypothetical protein
MPALQHLHLRRRVAVQTWQWKAMPMLHKLSTEVREIVWLASVVGSLSVVAVALAIAAAIALEHLSVAV